MNDRFDPMTLAGLAFFAAGGLLLAYVLLEPDASESGRSSSSARRVPEGRASPTGQKDDSPEPNRPTTTAGNERGDERGPAAEKAPGGGADAKRGWVPSTSREAVDAGAVGGDLPPADDACRERPDLIAIGKQIGTAVTNEVRATARMPVAEEVALGIKLESELNTMEPFRGKVDRPADVAKYGLYLQDLVDQLAAHSSRRDEVRFRVHVIHDDDFNAFALPGGVLGVNTGLIEGKNAVRDEAELVMVLGHEVAHVEKRHPVAIYEATRALLGTDVEPAIIVGAMLQMPIKSEYEHEADHRGIEIAARAQYDPGAAARLWHRMGNRAGPTRPKSGLGGLGDILDTAGQALSTHPPSPTRCSRIRGRAADVARAAGWQRYYRGETNLRRHIAGHRQPN
jgi:hypothetical protein